MWQTTAPVGRVPPRLRPIIGTLKVLLASNVVTALIIGYALSLKVFHIDSFGFGLYFLFITTDFIVQFSSAVYNRRRVNAIATKARNREQRLIEAGVTPKTPRIIMTAVGYREDGAAWQRCLRTLDAQRMMPQAIVCCVDGNDAPDMEMAHQFAEAYADRDCRIIHLEQTLAQVYKDAFATSLKSLLWKPRSRWAKFKRWFTSIPYPEEAAAHLYARKALYYHMVALHEKEDLTRCYRTLYTQPHGDKRTAMFTAFAVSLFLGAEAVFATDSDTLLESNALQEMWILLDSDPNYGAVTADVKIENWKDSFISLQSRLRYWMAFNIERACQSTFRCVTCISGPMALYRAHDLDSIIGMWLCQTFLGTHTTFGDDRHLTNCLLGKGLKTAYTHRTCCHSESPSTFIRWIRQQTRWSKSFYREAIWFPRAFAYHHIWLGVETLKQGLYPFILLATVFNILYGETPWLRLCTWAGTMFATAGLKGILACIISRDWRMLLFPGYPLLYFFGLLPSKLLALSTMGKTNWGTSARSSAERSRGESFGQKTWHVGHLAIFYLALITGLAHFVVHMTHINWVWFLPAFTVVPAVMLYWDELPFKYWLQKIFPKKKRQQEREAMVASPLFGTSVVEPPIVKVRQDADSERTAVSSMLLSPNGGKRSSATLHPEMAYYHDHNIPGPRMLHAFRRASTRADWSSAESSMDTRFADQAARYRAFEHGAGGSGSSDLGTPPYPPINGAGPQNVHRGPYPPGMAMTPPNPHRKSAQDILDSGQLWPSLPPPVVSAKGAWVWRPASRETSLSGHGDAEGSGNGKGGPRGGGSGEGFRVVSRTPSWLGTPGTPPSAAPPYASCDEGGVPGSSGRGSPFMGSTDKAPAHRGGDWAGRQAYGGGSVVTENPFIYSAADEYQSGPSSSSSSAHLGAPAGRRGPFLGPYGNYDANTYGGYANGNANGAGGAASSGSNRSSNNSLSQLLHSYAPSRDSGAAAATASRRSYLVDGTLFSPVTSTRSSGTYAPVAGGEALSPKTKHLSPSSPPQLPHQSLAPPRLEVRVPTADSNDVSPITSPRSMVARASPSGLSPISSLYNLNGAARSTSNLAPAPGRGEEATASLLDHLAQSHGSGGSSSNRYEDPFADERGINVARGGMVKPGTAAAMATRPAPPPPRIAVAGIATAPNSPAASAEALLLPNGAPSPANGNAAWGEGYRRRVGGGSILPSHHEGAATGKLSPVDASTSAIDEYWARGAAPGARVTTYGGILNHYSEM